MMRTKDLKWAARYLAAVLMFAALATTTAGIAQALEIIPSIGLTKSTDENAGDAEAMGGLAIRATLMPFLKAEGGISYRQDTFGDGALNVRQWPVTASLWATPFPVVYAGGGIGWYYTTFDYADEFQMENTTDSQMGVHLGGGITLPMSPQLSLDLSGRYVFMQADSDNIQVPTTFNPDFWTTSLGLAITF